MATTDKDLSGYSDLFKRLYGEWSTTLYGSGIEDPIEAKMPKKYGLGGEDLRFPIQTTFGGSAGFGGLPTANYSKHVTPVLDTHRAYARLLIDRRTMKASKSNEMAFKRAYDYDVANKVKNFTRIQAMSKYNDGTGRLGIFSTNATGTATNPVVTIDTTIDAVNPYGFRPAFFEEGDIVQIEQNVTAKTTIGAFNEADKFAITAVDTSAGTVTLERLSGSLDLTGLGGQDNALTIEGAAWGCTTPAQNTRKVPEGLLTINAFTSGSLYGASYARRWGLCHTQAAGGKLLTTDVLNRSITEFVFKTGEFPDLIIGSFKQYELFVNQEESKKRYEMSRVVGRDSSITEVKASFSGVKFQSARGNIDFVTSRYLRDDMVIITKMSKHCCHHLDGFGWFDDDGTVILRSADADSYEARFGGYYENFWHPFYVSTITGLATA